MICNRALWLDGGEIKAEGEPEKVVEEYLGGRTTMKWKEIVEKFNDEWVLIEVKEVDESYNLKEGDVIAHSKDKSEIYEQLLKLKDKNLYIEYTGKIPEDLAVVLFYENI